jgi:hypothetical protein
VKVGVGLWLALRQVAESLLEEAIIQFCVINPESMSLRLVLN